MNFKQLIYYFPISTWIPIWCRRIKRFMVNIMKPPGVVFTALTSTWVLGLLVTIAYLFYENGRVTFDVEVGLIFL